MNFVFTSSETMGCIRRNAFSSVFRNLYFAYGISCIGDRMWTFAVALLLQHLGGMRLVSINQLAEGITQMVLSTYVGSWLDRHDRKQGILTVLALNNISVALSAGLLSLCLTADQLNSAYFVCLILSIAACSLSTVASEGEEIAFTKDWLVEMAKRDKRNVLSRENAVMRTIDQLCAVISPLVAGFIFLKTGRRVACLLFVVWNFISWIAEAFLLVSVYYSAPELAIHESEDSKRLAVLAEQDEVSSRTKTSILSDWVSLIRIYWKQSVFPAAISLAFLYMTVLGFDGLAVSYGRSQGLTEDWLGGFRSLGSALGIAGAISYTVVERCVGVRRTGLLGLIVQQIALYLCVASVWLPGSPFDPAGYFQEIITQDWRSQLRAAFAVIKPNFANSSVLPPNYSEILDTDRSAWSADGHSLISVCMLLLGIALARVGLWMADLSVTQIMQERVPERERNTVFGVQNAVSQLFSVLKDVMVILLPDPRTFGLLIIVSVMFVTLGLFSYSYYLSKSREKTQERIVTNWETAKTTTVNASDSESIHPKLDDS